MKLASVGVGQHEAVPMNSFILQFESSLPLSRWRDVCATLLIVNYNFINKKGTPLTYKQCLLVRFNERLQQTNQRRQVFIAFVMRTLKII